MLRKLLSFPFRGSVSVALELKILLETIKTTD